MRQRSCPDLSWYSVRPKSLRDPGSVDASAVRPRGAQANFTPNLVSRVWPLGVRTRRFGSFSDSRVWLTTGPARSLLGPPANFSLGPAGKSARRPRKWELERWEGRRLGSRVVGVSKPVLTAEPEKARRIPVLSYFVLASSEAGRYPFSSTLTGSARALYVQVAQAPKVSRASGCVRGVRWQGRDPRTEGGAAVL